MKNGEFLSKALPIAVFAALLSAGCSSRQAASGRFDRIDDGISLGVPGVPAVWMTELYKLSTEGKQDCNLQLGYTKDHQLMYVNVMFGTQASYAFVLQNGELDKVLMNTRDGYNVRNAIDSNVDLVPDTLVASDKDGSASFSVKVINK